MNIRVKIKKLREGAVVPKVASAGAACFDLHACAAGTRPLEMGGNHGATCATFDTGLAFEVPEGHVMLIFSRSGHGFKNDVRLANCVGVIDSDYRGEVAVRLTADTQRAPLLVGHGDRIAQAMILPVPAVEFEEVEDLSTTARGAGGFGSTGA